jgi:hypothetical protein
MFSSDGTPSPATLVFKKDELVEEEGLNKLR